MVSGPDGASWASWEATAHEGGKFPQRHPSEAGQDGLPGDRMGSQDKSLQTVQYFTQTQRSSSNHVSTDVPLVSMVNSSAHNEGGSVAGNAGKRS